MPFFVMSQPSSPKPFRIEATVSGFPDHTMFFLQNAREMSMMDSAVVVNGRFNLQGSIKHADKVIIMTKNSQDYTVLWIESGDAITIQAEKGKFRDAVVSGSRTQKDADLLRSLVFPQGGSRQESYTRFIRRHPSSMVSANVLSVYASMWEKDTVSLLFGILSPEIKASFYGKRVSDFLAFNKNPQVGEKYTDFAQKNPEGKVVKLSDYAGKVVLLDFWATWCGPCLQENPELVKTYHAFKDKGFEILSVSIDEEAKREQWKKVIANQGLVWENISELNGELNKAALIYGVAGIPDSFLINRDGTIIARDLRGEKLREFLAKLFENEK